MADAEETKPESPKEEAKAEKSEKKSLVGRLLPIVIIIVVVGLCAGAGFSLGRLVAGPSSPEPPGSNSEADESNNKEAIQVNNKSGDSSEETWYYDFEPVIANLNEPSVARYISISITLQMSSELSEKDGRNLFDEKMPILTDWLTVYLSGKGLDDIRGDKNLKSIQSQILTAFNDQLFPDSKPKIKHVLFRNFAIQ